LCFFAGCVDVWGGAVKTLAGMAFALASIAAQGYAQNPAQSNPDNPNPAPTPFTQTTTRTAVIAPARPAAKVDTGTPVEADTLHGRRKAAKLYLRGVKLMDKHEPEAAWGLLKQAVEIEPGNGTYLAASELAKQSAVAQLVQRASQARSSAGPSANSNEATVLLKHALEIDPGNESATQHLHQLAEEQAGSPVGLTASSTVTPVMKAEGPLADGPIELETHAEKHSFHLHTSAKQVITEVYRAYGVEASLHDSVQARPVRFDLDDATFSDAVRVLGLVTHTFYEALDPHRVIVAADTRENRQQFQRMLLETVYLPGLVDKELTDVSNLARNVFDAQQSVAEPGSNTITLRAPAKALTAFNQTVSELVEGRSQVDLNVKIIQLSHVASKETGTTFFQQTGVFNVFSEINSVLSQNQSLVQQIIASGLVPNQSTLANQIEILAILVASGQLTGTPFNQGFLPFGGGLTQSILSPGPATLNFNLNSSDTRELDDIHLLLSDQEDGSFKTGERYPIETSSFSSVAIPALSQFAGLAGASNQTVPQIQYQDLGLTLKATPSILRSDDVAIKLDIKIDALGGTALNDIPILDSREMSGVLTLKAGETAVLLSDLTRTQSRALSGLPGVSDIPGLQDVSDIARNQNVARLLILVTPRVVREPGQLARGKRLPVDKASSGH
jgi:general secretion pathway protein D